MENYKQQFFAFTVDIDWAPDFTIIALAEKLIAHQIKCTWFVTHESPAVKALFKETALFEFGIHPNFLPNTNQGANQDEIINNLLSITPPTQIVRTHALVQSSLLLKDFYAKYDLTTDVSLFLPGGQGLYPHRLYLDNSGKYITRLPYFWEDDAATYIPNQTWDIYEQVSGHGLKIFDFHPMYVYLNMEKMTGYETLKNYGPLMNLAQTQVDAFVHQGKGSQYFLNNLIDFLVENQLPTYKISELTAMFDAI